MKIAGFYIMLIGILIFISCEKDDHVKNTNCSLLSDALINLHHENAKMDISVMLTPVSVILTPLAENGSKNR